MYTNGQKIVTKPCVFFFVPRYAAVPEGRHNTKPVDHRSQTVSVARFGYVASRKVGKAVERNKAKRRLRAAAHELGLGALLAEYDCVFVARRFLLTYPYQQLVKDIKGIAQRVKRGKTGVTQQKVEKKRVQGAAKQSKVDPGAL